MRRFLLLLMVACIIIIGDPIMKHAYAEIPDGVKDQYQYDKNDNSIIIVKRRLQELGYFSENAQLSDKVNITLRDRVIEFQKQNKVTADGVIDKYFLTLLFSDDAVGKDGKVKPKPKPILTAKPDKVVERLSENETVKPGSRSDKSSGKKSESGISPGALFAFVAAVAVLLLVFRSKSKKNTEYVMAHSKRYAAVSKLNRQCSFFDDIPYRYSLNYRLQSKKALDNADIDSYFLVLSNNDENLKGIYKKLHYNRDTYAWYLRNVEQTMRISDDYISELDFNYGKFLKIEDRICSPLRQPRMDISIDIKLMYESPKGQKSYYKSKTVHYDQLDYAYKEAQRILVRKLQAAEERSKMSQSLRYDILRRDGFRCTICGAGQEDGVKLHVDHIMPVSRGGKTVPENLRTLCDRCNLGKRDKYVSGSLN